MKFCKSQIILLLLLFCCVANAQQRFDVVIDEIMADPSPQVGLPNVEYIELKNVSNQSINLQGWKLLSASATSNAFPSYTLPPDSFVIIATSSGTAQLAAYGKTLAVTNFPSLANEGTVLSLISKDGSLIHFVNYTDAWYANEAKKDGGWSLEMIDAKSPCTGTTNWKASINDAGGTPGKRNSVDGVNKDSKSPALINAYAKDKTTITLLFDEPVDSATAIQLLKYSIQPAIAIQSIKVLHPDFTEVTLLLNASLDSNTVYTITVNGVQDCAGNAINSSKAFGIPKEATVNDVIINEIMFDPRPNEYDYVELYNRSNKIIDVSKLYLGNRASSGSVGSLKRLAPQQLLLLPKAYLVVTEDKSTLLKSYFVKDPNAMIEISALPSFPDDKGTVVIQNIQGTIIDELSYADDWQFELISNAEGVALERIDPELATSSKDNWHSAATTVGYGTPTYINSQYKQAGAINATIELADKIFSPDGDGFEDFAQVQYHVTETGYVANVYIFDASGKMVRHLAKNAVLGLKGLWQWDGLDENRKALPMGNYVVYIELFNLQGKKKSFKNAIVLAKKLR